MARNSKSRQAQNYFRLTKPPLDKDTYTIGEGRYRDIRFRIVNLRGEFVAVYIGIVTDNNFYGATISELKEAIPNIEWSYASPDLLHASNVRQKLWWVGWSEKANEVAPEVLVPLVKSTVSELIKGELHGEIGTNH